MSRFIESGTHNGLRPSDKFGTRTGFRFSLAVLTLLSLSTVVAPAPAAAQAKKKAGRSDAASAVLDRAIKLYDSDELYSATIELYKVVEGRIGRQRSQQAEGRVLDGQGALQAQPLLGRADLLRSHRAEGPGPRPLQRDAQVAGLVVARSGRLGRHPGEDRQIQPQGSGTARAGERARRALLPAGQVPLHQEQLQRGRLAVQAWCRRRAPFTCRPSCSRARPTCASTRPSPPSTPSRRCSGVGDDSDDPKVKPFEDLANLSMARTFYSTGQYELAAKYFDRVSLESYDWRQQPVRSVVGELHAQARRDTRRRWATSTPCRRRTSTTSSSPSRSARP